jgi:hypothetical protein
VTLAATAFAAPLYAQSAGSWEVGASARTQYHDPQLLVPVALSPTTPLTGLESTRPYAQGLSWRIAGYVDDNLSLEANFAETDQGSIRNGFFALRLVQHTTEKKGFSAHLGGGLLANGYSLAGYFGRPRNTEPTTPFALVPGSSNTDFGLNGIVGLRYRLLGGLALRFDATANFLPFPTARRNKFTTLRRGDINYGVEAGLSYIFGDK